MDASEKASGSWTDGERDAFLATTIGLATAKMQYHQVTGVRAATLSKSLVELVDALPPVTDARVARLLDARIAGRAKLPEMFPRELSAALALAKTHGIQLGRPASKRRTANCIAPLADFHLRHAGLGVGRIVPPAKLPALHRAFVKELRAHAEEDEPIRPPDGDMRSLSRPERLIPFGKSAGGDYFFFDPAVRKGKVLAILRFVHDEANTCRVEASSLASFAARQTLEAALGVGPLATGVAKLVARDCRGIKLPTNKRRG